MIDNIINGNTMIAAVLRLLHQEWVTVAEALHKANCYSLSQRAGDLRKLGYNVIDKWVKLPSGKRVKAYRIPPVNWQTSTDDGCFFVTAGQLDRAALAKPAKPC